MTNAEEIATFGQSNLEAAMRSTQILATGWQDIARRATESTQAHLESGMSLFRELCGVKSIREAMDIQNSFARSAIEKGTAEGTQFVESTMKLAERAMAPIAERATAVAEKMHVPA